MDKKNDVMTDDDKTVGNKTVDVLSVRKAVVIVAGGSGTRMGASVPKQFLPLAGRPVLMRTVELFASVPLTRVILVLPASQIAYWQELCAQYGFQTPIDIAHGGQTRFESVGNGLALVADEELVAVHDGVRPLVSRATIVNAFACAMEHGTGIPCHDCVESVRMTTPDGANHAVDRSTVRLVQTPQAFRTQLLKAAYAQPYNPLFTDDASVVEAYGHHITLCDGNNENIKMTTPIDMAVAEMLMDGRWQEKG